MKGRPVRPFPILGIFTPVFTPLSPRFSPSASAILFPTVSNKPTEGRVTTKHLNQNELATRWAISPRTLERWRWTGEGPKFIKIGGRVAYRLEDVIAFELEQIRQSTPGGTRVSYAGGRA